MATYASWHSTAQAGVDALANITDNVTVSDDSYWQANAYDQIRAIYIELGSSPGAGVPGNFTLNNDNSTADTEDAYIYAERGILSPNAHIRWDSAGDAWELSNNVRLGQAGSIVYIDGYIGNSSNRTTKHWLVDEDVSGTLTVNNLTLSGTLSGGSIDVSGATGVNSDTFTIDQNDTNFGENSGVAKFAVSRNGSSGGDAFLGFDELNNDWVAYDGYDESTGRVIVRVGDGATVTQHMLNTDIYSDSGGLWGTEDTLARSDHTHSGGGLAASGTSETIFTFDDNWSTSNDVHITAQFANSTHAISINPDDSTSGTSYFDFTHGLIPTTDDSIDLGTTSLRWKKLWLKDADIDGTLDIGGAATLQSTLNVTGDTDIDGTINVAGVGTFQDNIYLEGNSLTLNNGQVAGDASFKVALGSGSGDRELKWNNSTNKWTMKSTASGTYVDIVGTSGSQTLIYKELTSPTITGGTWTGNPTISGDPTFGGAPSFNGSPVFSSTPSFTNNPTFTGSPAFSSGIPSFSNTPTFSNATPFTVSNGSAGTIPNLDADKLDGKEASAFLQLDNTSAQTMSGDLDMNQKDIINIGSLGDHASSHMTGSTDALTGTFGSGVVGTNATTWRVDATSNTSGAIYLGASSIYKLDIAHTGTPSLGMGGSGVDLIPGSNSNNQDLGNTVQRWRSGNFNEYINLNIQANSDSFFDIRNGSLWAKGGDSSSMQFRLDDSNLTVIDSNNETGMIGSTGAWSVGGNIDVNNNNIINIGNLSGNPVFTDAFSIDWIAGSAGTTGAPFTIDDNSLTDKVTHLNADRVDSKEASDFLWLSGGTRTLADDISMGSNNITGIGNISGTPTFTDTFSINHTDPESTMPFTVDSSLVGKVVNLNADKVDGKDADELLNLTGGTMTGDITMSNDSDIDMDDNSINNLGDVSGTPTFIDAPTFAHGPATTAPFALGVNNTGVVTRLNADKLDGYDSSAFLQLAGGTMLDDLNMGTKNIIGIGSLTGASFTDAPFFALTGSGAQPFSLNSNLTGKVTHLNADKLDGYDSSAFLQLAGGTMLDDLNMGNKDITGLNHLIADGTTIGIKDELDFKNSITGDVPFSLHSSLTGKIDYLNADTVDGREASDFLLSGGDTMGGNLTMGGNDITGIGDLSGNNAAINIKDSLAFSVSEIGAGLAPFSVTGLTGKVADLHADKLDDKEASDFLWIDGSKTMGGPLNMGGNNITNIGGSSDFLSRSGGTMAGDIDMDDNYIKDVKFTNSGSDVPNFVTTSDENSPFTLNGTGMVGNLNADQVDNKDAADFLWLSAGTATNRTLGGDLAMGGNAITGASASSDFLLRSGSSLSPMTGDLHMGNKNIRELTGLFSGLLNKINIYDKLEFTSSINTDHSDTVPFVLNNNLNSTVQYLNADRVDSKEASDFLWLSGGTMGGNLAMGGNAITGASASSDFLLRSGTSASPMTGDLYMGNNRIRDVTYIYGGSTSNRIYIKDELYFSTSIKDDHGDTRPFILNSQLSDMVDHLNADMVDGKHAEDFLLLDGTQMMTGDLTMNLKDIQYINNAELRSMSSDFLVDKIEVKNYFDFKSDIAGTVPFTLDSSLNSKVTYLNADRVDDKEATDFLLRDGTQDMTDDLDMGGKNITNTDKVYIGSGNSYLESYNGGGGEEIRLYVDGTLAETWS